MTIVGKLVDVGVDAKSGIGQTTRNAKNRMVVQVKNHADGSQVRETLTNTGASQPVCQATVSRLVAAANP